jgi:hypothetical protein
MALFGWFKKNKKSEDIQVKERKKSVLQDTAAAVAFAEAGEHETARIMVDKQSEPRKILVIGREERFSEKLVDYSVSMAKRLSFEIVALNITAAPLSMPADKGQEAAVLFHSHSLENVSTLQKQAQDNGVGFTHLVEIGRQDEVVEKLHAKYPNMRYVLTEPDPEATQNAQGKISIPVFDLGSYQSSAA